MEKLYRVGTSKVRRPLRLNPSQSLIPSIA
jgi:hypothetical protein